MPLLLSKALCTERGPFSASEHAQLISLRIDLDDVDKKLGGDIWLICRRVKQGIQTKEEAAVSLNEQELTSLLTPSNTHSVVSSIEAM